MPSKQKQRAQSEHARRRVAQLPAESPKSAAYLESLLPPEQQQEIYAARLRARSWEVAGLVFRLAIPVVGLLVLGLPSIAVGLLYLFECWLFAVLRLTVSDVLQSRRRHELGPVGLAFKLLLRGLGVGTFLAFCSGVALLALGNAFRQEEWQDFSQSGWRDPVFLACLVALGIQAAWDIFHFTTRLHSRSQEERDKDDRLLLSRILAIFLSNFLAFATLPIVPVFGLTAFLAYVDWPAPIETPAQRDLRLAAEAEAEARKHRSRKR